MPRLGPVHPHTVSRAPCPSVGTDIGMWLSGCLLLGGEDAWREKLLVVTPLPSSPVQEESWDGAAKKLSVLCQPGTAHATCVPSEPTESQIC